MKSPHIATVWKSQGTDWHGIPTWSDPIHIRCRWEDQQKFYITENGQEARGRSVVLSENPIGDFGDYILLGESSELSPPTNSYTIKDSRSVTTLSGSKTEYRVIV